jgi:hypothetical protein
MFMELGWWGVIIIVVAYRTLPLSSRLFMEGLGCVEVRLVGIEEEIGNSATVHHRQLIIEHCSPLSFATSLPLVHIYHHILLLQIVPECSYGHLLCCRGRTFFGVLDFFANFCLLPPKWTTCSPIALFTKLSNSPLSFA